MKEIINISEALGQASSIEKTYDVIYLLDGKLDKSIILERGVNATIIDNSLANDINILVKKDSVLNYIILNSNNVKRHFDVLGELRITEINLDNVNEALEIELSDENAVADVKTLSIASNTNLVFNQVITHKFNQTFSNIKNIGVAMNGANITFATTGKIEKGMNKTKCSQLSRGVVMDDNSQITAKPILLIDEYDCFANHGASIGKMSDEDLFYLMSRGLTKGEAFLLILEGMIRPFIDEIPTEELKNSINDKIKDMIEK